MSTTNESARKHKGFGAMAASMASGCTSCTPEDAEPERETGAAESEEAAEQAGTETDEKWGGCCEGAQKQKGACRPSSGCC